MLPLLHLGPFQLYTFGLAFGVAVCTGWFIFEQYFRRHGLIGPVNMRVLGTICICSGFLGSKLDKTLVRFLCADHPGNSVSSVFINPAVGYTYLGCVLLGWLGGAIYFRLRGIPALRGYDSLFCIGPAYALGRIGCFFSGDGDYGIPTTLPWAVSFPHGIIPTTARVHPTMLYISLWETAVFFILWRISNPARKPPLRHGTILGLYLIATSAGRFAVEFLSLNPKLAWGLTEAQLVSAALATGGILLLLALRFGHRANPINTSQAASAQSLPTDAAYQS